MATQTVNYQCPSCTGPLHYNSATGKLSCDYCGSEFAVDEIEALYAKKAAEAERNAAKEAQQPPQEEAWDTAGAGTQWDESEAAKLRTYVCTSCGAELICDETTAATACVYCGNPTVIPGKLSGALRPDYVLPFRLEKKDAIAALEKYYRKKRFLPKSFRTHNQIEKLQGVYVPFWLFAGESEGSVQLDATRTHSYSTNDEEVTITEHYQLDRAGRCRFERIPVDGSTKMPDAHMDAIEPFDFSGLEPFTLAYLPGYLADQYDVSVEQSASRADTRCTASCESALRSTVTGYTTCTPETQTVRIRRGQVQYALLPVWMLHTKWKGKD